MSTVVWFIGFGLMMASFSFLLGKPEETRPRISVDPWWPMQDER